MPEIDVTLTTYNKVQLAAQVAGITHGAVVDRLVDQAGVGSPTAPASDPDTAVLIYAIYRRKRVDAIFDPATKRVEITSGPLAGQAYGKPSPAAAAVVAALNPSVHPNRDGWTFWRLARTGDELKTLR